MRKTVFSGQGVQSKGIIASYDFECDNVSVTNKVFWKDAQFTAPCDTHSIKNFNALGFCKYEDNGGVTICINFADVEKRCDDYNDFVLSFSAIDYHELAHAFYGVRWPVKDYKPKNGYTAEQVFRALNYLVDQRDENWWLNDYPRTQDYFQYLCMHPKILKGLGEKPAEIKSKKSEKAKKSEEQVNKHQAATFLLTWGRRFYLPDSYIKIVTESFLQVYGEEPLEAIKNVIDKFLYSTTFEEQEELVYEFLDILKENQISSGLGTGEGEDEDEEWGTIEMDMETFKNMVKNGGLNPSGSSGSAKIKIKITDYSGEGSGGGSGEEQEEADGEQQDSDNGDLDEYGNVPSESFDDLKDKMRNEADRMAKSIKSNAQQAGVQKSDAIGDPFKPSSAALSLKKNLESIFSRARTNLGSHHVRRITRGALDIPMAKISEKTEDSRIFRKFMPSKIKKMQTAVALVLDQSGSMTFVNSNGVTNIQAATDITWALAAALHNFDGVTSVIGFDVQGRKMKEFVGRMENWYLKADGGTNPGTSLDIVAEDIKLYLKQHLPCMAIIITDGEWYDDKGPKSIKKLNKLGVWTVEFLLKNQEHITPHGCKYTFDVTNIYDCAKHIEKVMQDIQLEARRKLGG